MPEPFLIVEEHHVHVAKGIEFTAAVTTERHHRKRSGGGAFVSLRETRGRREDVAQHDVNQLDAERANLPAASAGLMAQAKPVFLDFQEFLVERQSIRRPPRAALRQARARHAPELFRDDGKWALWSR